MFNAERSRKDSFIRGSSIPCSFAADPIELKISNHLWDHSALVPFGTPGPTPDSTEGPSCICAWCALNSASRSKCPTADGVQKPGDVVADHVSSSSSDRGSK
ncbi:hypothetical protein AVEN_86843-1 [Araneus ventricosus]|uniref:Uncharacterized protein n=1 Tax=Araneus ventricosus TaxID=182803 RepID=A0A4Y2CZQ4_ARAVE|nr:hypothetical protein AVEN_86843-1 [Araneus ventricosus]